MKLMRVYVSGPMRGHPEFNYPAFNATAASLRATGHIVFNPAENDAGSLRANLASDMSWIALVADCVVMLPGWQESLGAKAEYALARAIGIQVWELEDFITVPETAGRTE